MLFSLECSITVEPCAISVGKILTNNNNRREGKVISVWEFVPKISCCVVNISENRLFPSIRHAPANAFADEATKVRRMACTPYK